MCKVCKAILLIVMALLSVYAIGIIIVQLNGCIIAVKQDVRISWDAVQSVSGIFVPIVLAIFGYIIQGKQVELEKSNKEKIEELKNFNDKYGEALIAWYRVYTKKDKMVMNGGSSAVE